MLFDSLSIICPKILLLQFNTSLAILKFKLVIYFKLIILSFSITAVPVIPEINFKGKTCGVVDERGEIAAMYQGIPQNDVGIRTDVVENISKAKGMKMLIRSMAPEVIACDEIGSKEDVEAIRRSNFGRSERDFYHAWKNTRRYKK